MKIVQKYKLTIIGVLAGVVGGYFYYYFIGCASGSCAISSKPLSSIVYGALMGGLLFHIFQKENSKTE